MISKFFSYHSNSRAFDGLIKNLDREKIELHLIHAPDSIEDSTRKQIDKYAENIHTSESYSAAIEDLRRLDLDILFYTDIGMEIGITELAMQRAAPIQVTGWGIPHTSGMASIDYYISSDLAEPEDADIHYTERLVRLPSLPCCYLSENLYNDEDVPSEYFFLPSGIPLIGCLQSLHKLHPDFDHALEQIAQRVEEAAFIFVEGRYRAHTQIFLDRIKKNAPTVAERLAFLTIMNRREFMALSNIIDVLLDPFHYGSGITFYESSFMGTPIVTLEGNYLRARLVAAGYRMIGVEQPPIASSQEEYVEIVARLMEDPIARASLKEEIRNKARAHLYDDLNYVRAFEDFCERAVAGSL